MVSGYASTSRATQAQLSVFGLRTSHLTSVGIVGEGEATTLVHGLPSARTAYFIETGSNPEKLVLLDVITLVGDPTIRIMPVASADLILVDKETGLVSLRNPLSSKFFSASPSSEKITIDREKAEGWEHFVLLPVDANLSSQINSAILDLLVEFNAESQPLDLLDPKLVLFLATKSDKASVKLLLQILQIMKPDALLALITELSPLKSYELTFPIIQDRLSRNKRRFEYQVRDRLAREIGQYGWNIGDHSYGSPTVIEPNLGKLTIGKYCSMNDFVVILGNHVTDATSSYPFSTLSRFWPSAQATPSIIDHVSKDVSIGNDVWIGNGALILPGTTVGDGVVIGAHAVARGNIPPYAIVVGNPGKIIRFRFDTHIIDKLIEIAWWNWPDYEVDRFITLIMSSKIEDFIKRVEEDRLIVKV